jgi:hypothetical protein
MDKTLKHRYSGKQSLPLALGPDDLDRMQRIFELLCLDEMVNSFSQAECNALARAVVKAYDPTMTDDLVRAIALFNYDATVSEMAAATWEGLKVVGVRH